MPSELHQNLALVLREHLELTVELAIRAGVPITGTVLSIEETVCEFDDPLDPCNPVVADLALIIHTTTGTFGLVVEVQLGEDDQKEWTTVLYRAALRRRIESPAWSLIFSPEASVRRGFLQRMFRVEPELRPYVIMPELLPLIRDQNQAVDDYPAAVLGVAMHPCEADIETAALVIIRVLLRLAPSDYMRYIQAVSTSIGEGVMQQVRERLPPEDLEPLSAFERRGSSFQSGLREGRVEGRVEGRMEGWAEARAEVLASMQSAVQDVLAVRNLLVSEGTQARITAVTDIDRLCSLIARAATIADSSSLFDD